MKKFNESKVVQICLFIGFATINFFILKDYVIWRDVARPLLYINDSSNLIDLFKIIRYEGSPMLYHSCIWLISKFTPATPLIAKIFHYCIHLCLIYVIIFSLKIPNIFKLLLLLQTPQLIYLLYVRQYSLTILFILLFCHIYSISSRRDIRLYFLIFLMTQTVIHGCLVGMVLFMFLIIDSYINEKKIFFKSYLIPILGIILCYIQFIPPSDLIEGLKSWKPLFSTENIIFIQNLFWDILFNRIWSALTLILLTILIIKNAYAKDKYLTLNICFCLTTLLIGFILLGCFKYSFNRHHWLYSYTWIGFLIILYSKYKTNLDGKNLNLIHYSLVVLVFICLCNFVVSLNNLSRLFSNGKNVAEFLDKRFPDQTVLSKVEFYYEPVQIYRKNPKPYYSLGRQKFVKYTILNHPTVDYTKYKDYFITVKYSDLLKDLNNTPDKILSSNPILIIAANEGINDLPKDLNKEIIKSNYHLVHIKDFTGAYFENYYIFHIIKNNLSS